MKFLLFIILALFLWIVVADAAPAKAAPKPTVDPQLLVAVRSLVAELGTENAKLVLQVDNLHIQNVGLTKANTQLQVDIANLESWGQKGWDSWQTSKMTLEKMARRYFFLKSIALVIAGILGALVALQFSAKLPPPYSFGIPVGVAAVVVTSLTFML